MSYDVNIGSASFNYTSNLSPFFQAMFPWNAGSERGLKALNGKTGSEAVGILRIMFANIAKAQRQIGPNALMSKYNPGNNFGCVLSATAFLGELMAACAQAPKELVNVYA